MKYIIIIILELITFHRMYTNNEPSKERQYSPVYIHVWVGGGYESHCIGEFELESLFRLSEFIVISLRKLDGLVNLLPLNCLHRVSTSTYLFNSSTPIKIWIWFPFVDSSFHSIVFI